MGGIRMGRRVRWGREGLLRVCALSGARGKREDAGGSDEHAGDAVGLSERDDDKVQVTLGQVSSPCGSVARGRKSAGGRGEARNGAFPATGRREMGAQARRLGRHEKAKAGDAPGAMQLASPRLASKGREVPRISHIALLRFARRGQFGSPSSLPRLASSLKDGLVALFRLFLRPFLHPVALECLSLSMPVAQPDTPRVLSLAPWRLPRGEGRMALACRCAR